MSVAVVEERETAASWARGSTTDALFQAGSVSKPVAALTALRLAEAGALELDRDVNERLVTWRVPRPGITLRDLLGHTAGLGVPYFPGYVGSAPLPTLPQVLDGLPPAVTPPVRPEDEPGGGFRYSGGGYAALQLLLEDATGASLGQLASELVFGPLGMRSSTFEQPLPERLHSLAVPGSVDGEPVEGGWHVYPEAAAAGLWTTPEDLARLVSALQRALAGSGPVSGETARLMVEPRRPLPAEGEWTALRTLGIAPPEAFGLGLFLDAHRFGHLGGTEGYFCAVVGSLRDGTGAAVMSNSNASPAFFEALLSLADEQGWPGYGAET